MQSTWMGHAAAVLIEVCLRSLPCVLYLLVQRSVQLRTKLALGLALLGLVVLALQSGAHLLYTFALPVAGLCYFALLSAVVFWAARVFAGDPPSKLVLLLLLAFAFIGVPAAVMSGPASTYVQLVGWELTFAAHSYCLEAAKGGRRPRFGECIFFLLVNPVLVFPDRGTQVGAPAPRPAALLRCAGGICALLLAHLLYEAAYSLPALAVAPLYAVTTAHGYVHFALHYGTRLLGGYAGHSGLASLQIDWMRLLGHDVPERFRLPLLAKSPTEFWRRWNTYVGSWARRYMFVPLSLWLRRHSQTLPAPLLTAAAVVLTFAAVGAAHDLSVYVRLAAIGAAGGTLVFTLHGVLLVGWLGVQRSLAPKRVSASGRLAGTLQWLLFMHVMLLTTWLVIPGMSGEGLALPLLELALLFGRKV